MTYIQNLMKNYELTSGKKLDISNFEKGSKSVSTELNIEQINNKIRIIQLEKQENTRTIFSLREHEEVVRKGWYKVVEAITENKIKFSKTLDKISFNLSILNKDYKMTYETLSSQSIPPLPISEEKAKVLREDYRKEISELGFVNLDAIEKYKVVSKDYWELKTNTNDLEDTKNKLLSSIKGMDLKMIDQFSTTFEMVNKKFNDVFKVLFRGGTAKIVYDDPENILDSGVSIIAQSPGKIVKNLELFSGGEKSLIALSLIFAINEVKNLPILMLDEVEAALDESNVERFAKFSKELNSKTQIIITSHRPGTMEMADIIYGVTMQQKGITKIVSIKLEEAINLAD